MDSIKRGLVTVYKILGTKVNVEIVRKWELMHSQPQVEL